MKHMHLKSCIVLHLLKDCNYSKCYVTHIKRSVSQMKASEIIINNRLGKSPRSLQIYWFKVSAYI